MSEARRYKYPLQLPISLKETVAHLAREDEVSLNQWITAAVAQKIEAAETADALLKRRAATARPGDLARYLDRALDLQPVPRDELPDR